jgi:hypothetical protein
MAENDTLNAVFKAEVLSGDLNNETSGGDNTATKSGW